MPISIAVVMLHNHYILEFFNHLCDAFETLKSDLIGLNCCYYNIIWCSIDISGQDLYISVAVVIYLQQDLYTCSRICIPVVGFVYLQQDLYTYLVQDLLNQ